MHDARVGVLYDYFAADSDVAAAAMVDETGGPAGPGGSGPLPEGLAEAVRSGDREALRLLMRPKVVTSPTGTLVLQSKGIDPVVQLGTLESLLTGTPYQTVVGNPRSGALLASLDDVRLVLTLTDELQQALATSTADQLRAVAAAWSATDEFHGTADPQELAAFLDALADLAHRATGAGLRLYCWISV
jgi:hypothetical protein